MAGSTAFFGRADELRTIRQLVAGVRAGQGRSVLIEGEPGIGKSSLLHVGLAYAARRGVRVLGGAADELNQRFPLAALLSCLSAEERAGVVAATGGPDAGGSLLAVTERLLSLVDRACAERPVALVLDDLQWADEATAMVWHQLARSVGQLPLLLVGAVRPVPKRPEITRLRRALRAAGSVVIVLGPLPAAATTELVAALAGAPAGPHLAALAEQAGGNPLYLGELVDALRRESRIRVGARAELTGSAGTVRPPGSLVAAITDRLSFLTEPATRLLRVAALLGPEFSVVDLATFTGRTPTALMATVEEGILAGVLSSAGARLTFRHPLIRRVLYESTPPALRTALHHQAARALAADGAAVERVAEHLIAAESDAVDEWLLGWLRDRAPALANRAPQVAVVLVKRALGALADGDPRRESLEDSLVVVQRVLRNFAEAELLARRVRERTADPDRAAHMAWIRGYCLLGTGRVRQALDVLAETLDDGAVPPRWRARLLALRSVALGASGHYDEALAAAGQAHRDGAAAADRYAVALALHAQAQTVARSDTRAGLDLIDQGLALAPGGADGVDLRLLLLGNRLDNLTILDRRAEAASTAREALELAETANTARYATTRVTVAQAHFAAGRWDDALVELEPAADMLAELAHNRPKLLAYHGLAALIAAHRDHREAAAAHLRAVEHIPVVQGVLQRSSDYLMLARAAVAERNGHPRQAIAALAPALDAERAKDLTRRHPVMPDLVRLALAVADLDLARAATAACAVQTENGRLPGTVAAVNHCRGFAAGDEGLLRAAAGYYHSAGRPWEFGQTMEDLAVLLAGAQRAAAARAAFGAAVEAYTTLGAAWDIRRVETRVRAFGIRRGQRGPRHRPATGWAALTPTEVTVAGLVAEGLSNPDIAEVLMLSRRTVQTHVSHILAKLRVRSRVDIARHALEHRTPPAPERAAPPVSGFAACR